MRRQLSVRGLAMLLAAAAGVMLGASMFSLLIPALDQVREATGSTLESVLVASAGLLLGALGIWILYRLVPHERTLEAQPAPDGDPSRHHWLFILAITLHNFPEGMSVGVAYAADPVAGTSVAVAIGIQNLPEGLAVAAALLAAGGTRARAIAIALGTGLVEPLGGLLGAAALGFGALALPWGLSIAAGAMLFVIAEEVIPETHLADTSGSTTISLIVGFVVMMLLDVTLS
jgi:ZIP family zinc transporter